jgi:hypothetical protein
MLIYFAAGLFLAFLARSATKTPGTGHASVKADMATGGVNNARAAMHLSKYNHDPQGDAPHTSRISTDNPMTNSEMTSGTSNKLNLVEAPDGHVNGKTDAHQ